MKGEVREEELGGIFDICNAFEVVYEMLFCVYVLSVECKMMVVKQSIVLQAQHYIVQ